MRWFNWLGVGLQVVGLLGAMYLLARLKENVTGRPALVRRWLRRLRVIALGLVGHAPAPAKGQAVFDVEAITDSVHGVTTRGPMPDGLALDEQVVWLERFIRDLERRHNALSSSLSKQASTLDAAVRDARRYAEREISKAVAETRAEILKLVGQDVGREMFALFVIIIGIVLAAL